MKKIFTLLMTMTFSLSLFANLILKDGIYYQLSKEYTYPYRDVAVVSLEDAYSYFVYDTTSRYYTGDIIIPDTIEYESKRYVVTALSDGLFCNCTKLRSVSIPATVTAIGNDVFVNCPALETINVDQDNPKYTLVDGILFNKTRDVLYCCPSKIAKSEFSISDSVKVVLPYAFDNCVNLKKIDVGKVPLVCGCAFKNCTNLESVIFSAQVSLYDSYSFKEKYGWDEVCSLEYAMSQYAYEYPIFLGCSSLKNVEFKDLTVIPDAILKGCESVEEIIIPEGVTKIGYDAFNGCKSVKSFNIPSSVTELGYYAFDSCVSLSAVYYGGSIEQWVMLFDNAYGYANNNPLKYAHNLYVNSTLVTKVVLPEMETIPSYVFDGATCIDTIIISSNTHKIGDCAFANCTGLKHISFGKDLQSIGKFILANCNNLESVEWNVIRLSDPYLWQLYNWQGGVYEDYSSSFGYLRFEFDEYDFRQNIKSFIFGEEVEIIPDMLCEGLNIKEITIPRSVRQISSYAFASCSNLETIYWLATEYYDSEYPQYGIFSHGYEESNVSSIIFGDTIHYIPSYLCAGMTKLANIRMPLLADSIGRYAFACTGDMNRITIPAGVSKIGYGAFSGYITSPDYTWNMNQHHLVDTLVLPSTLISIDTMAFGDCEVANVMYNGTIGDWCHISFADYGSSPLEWIGGNWYCQGRLIEHLVIPDSITEIKRGAFCGFKNLKSLTLPDGLLTIGREAFANCNLDTIIIPNSVETIGTAAFIGTATKSTYMEIGSNVQYLECQSLDAFPYDQQSVIKCFAVNPPSTENMGCFPIQNTNVANILLYVPDSSLTLYQQDDYWKLFHLQAMSSYQNNSADSGICGDSLRWKWTCDSVLTITGTGRMYDYNASPWPNYTDRIIAVNIPNTVTNIGSNAFSQCSKLTSITIPNSVKSIGNYAFYNCTSLESLTIPQSVESIGNYVFYNCKSLTSIQVETGNTHYISEDGVLFTYLKDTLIIYPASNKRTSYTIPNSVVGIKLYAFEHSANLTSIGIPNSVTRIEEGTFALCTGLSSITLPSSIKSLSYFIFSGCTGLKSITCEATTPPNWVYGDLSTIDTPMPLYVPMESINAYKAANGWKEFTNIQAISQPNNVITYAATEKLPRVINPPSIAPSPWDTIYFGDAFDASIVSHEFSDGKGTITFDKDLTVVGESAFDAFHNLQSVKLPNMVKTLGWYAFDYCTSLTSFQIPDSVSSIGEWAFFGCKNLSYFEVSPKNKSYEAIDSVLYRSDSLVQYPAGNARESYTIPSWVRYIKCGAFSDATNLKSLTCEAINPPTCCGTCFFNMDTSIPVYVPAESVMAYKTAYEWSNFTNIRAIGSDDCQDYYFVQDTTLCWGDTTLYWRGQWSYRSYNSYQTWNRNGEYSTRYYEDIDTLVEYHYTINGCDSVYYLAVHYKGAYISVRYDTIQQGETHWSGNSQTGIYYNHVYDMQGCDSIIYEIHLYVQPIQYYTITTAVNNTKYGSVEGAGTYLAGDTVILTATPKKGYQFTQWNDGNTDNPRLVAVTKDAAYTAQFAIKQCSWLVESSDLEMGAVYTDFTNEYYNYGTQITVEASPNSGYKFVKWNDGKKYNPYKFSLLEDKYLLAIFMADEEEMDTTTVQPADTTATFQWPFIEGGYTYTLTIYADQNYTKPICTLTFNQYGQLVSINFMYGAPKRHGTGTQPETFVCTVNGLEAGQEYYYKMQTTDEEGRLLNTDEGGFTTTQGGTPTSHNQTSFPSGEDRGEASKIILNGQLLILRDGKTYNAQGTEVK